MRAIWKGAITFGLVNIPVSLYPATRREELKFHLLRTADLSPINYKLREALKQSGRIAIAKVVIKTRQHLAAVKPQGEGLILELMHFPQELVDLAEFKAPAEQNLAKQELQMALKLIDSITNEWHPEEYTDEYREKLERLIDQKIQKGGKAGRTASASTTRHPANVVDLVAVLQQSIQKTEHRPRKAGARAGSPKPVARARRKAA